MWRMREEETEDEKKYARRILVLNSDETETTRKT
jgi:hypothetical protein